MDVQLISLVLLDISGYTRFTTAHKVNLLHAELIIDNLLDNIISKSKYPLVVHELLGDAITFYVQSDGNAEVAREVRRK